MADAISLAGVLHGHKGHCAADNAVQLPSTLRSGPAARLALQVLQDRHVFTTEGRVCGNTCGLTMGFSMPPSGLSPRQVTARPRDSKRFCDSSRTASSWATIPPIEALQDSKYVCLNNHDTLQLKVCACGACYKTRGHWFQNLTWKPLWPLQTETQVQDSMLLDWLCVQTLELSNMVKERSSQ